MCRIMRCLSCSYLAYKNGRYRQSTSTHFPFKCHHPTTLPPDFCGWCPFVVAIIVESALPLSIVGIIFSAVLKQEAPVEIFFAITLGACVVCFQADSLTKNCCLQLYPC